MKSSTPVVGFTVPKLPNDSLTDLVIEFDIAQVLDAVSPMDIRIGVALPFANQMQTLTVPIQQKLPLSMVQNVVMSTMRVPFSLFPNTTIASLTSVFFSFAQSPSKGTLYVSELRVTL